MYMAHVHMTCGLHSVKSTGTRGVKMFPTKTSSNVEMVGCVSEATGSCMEKPTGGKSPGTRCIPQCNNPVSIRQLQDTYFGYVFIIPTTGNILMRLGQCTSLLSWPQNSLKYVGPQISFTISHQLMYRRFEFQRCAWLVIQIYIPGRTYSYELTGIVKKILYTVQVAKYHSNVYSAS